MQLLGKELYTFNTENKDINTNEKIEVKIVKYERGQICFYYKNEYIPRIDTSIIITPISYKYSKS